MPASPFSTEKGTSPGFSRTVVAEHGILEHSANPLATSRSQFYQYCGAVVLTLARLSAAHAAGDLTVGGSVESDGTPFRDMRSRSSRDPLGPPGPRRLLGSSLLNRAGRETDGVVRLLELPSRQRDRIGRSIMDSRYLTKRLWVAAVVTIALGAFGRGVLEHSMITGKGR